MLLRSRSRTLPGREAHTVDWHRRHQILLRVPPWDDGFPAFPLLKKIV